MTTPAARRESPAERIRTRVIQAGSKGNHALERVPQVLNISPDQKLSRFMEQCKLPGDAIDDAMILLVYGPMSPERRPPELSSDDLDLWDADTGARLVYARGHLEKARDGWLIGELRSLAHGVFGLFGRAFRQRTMREVRGAERPDDDDFGGQYA